MEALQQVGDKSHPKPPNPYESLHCFHIIRSLTGLPLIIHGSWDNVPLTQPNNSQMVMGLVFPAGSPTSLSPWQMFQ